MGESKPRKEFYLLPKIINGGIAGIVGLTAIFPLDLVKTRLQNQQIGPNGELMYTSITDCFKKTYRADGYFGMYRGALVNIMLVTPDRAIKLAANDFFRYHLVTKEGTLPMPQQIVSGGLAGFCQVVVIAPRELLKIQMQDAGRTGSQKMYIGKDAPRMSATRLTIDILKREGIFGMYRGASATLLRDISFSAIYFPLFAALDALGPRKKDGSGDAVFWCSFLAGCAAGCVAAFVVTPFDVVKTRLQLLRKGKGEKTYKGIPDAFVKIARHEGINAFFKGGACRVMAIAPLFGIAQMIYYLGIAEALLGIEK